eukprot:5328276-Amphidinium_carterae.1
MQAYLGSAPHEVISSRASKLRDWSMLKSQGSRSSRFGGLDPSINHLLNSKDFAFWEASLNGEGYPEVEVVAEAAS